MHVLKDFQAFNESQDPGTSGEIHVPNSSSEYHVMKALVNRYKKRGKGTIRDCNEEFSMGKGSNGDKDGYRWVHSGYKTGNLKIYLFYGYDGEVKVTDSHSYDKVKILGWIAFSDRPLNMDEVYDFFPAHMVGSERNDTYSMDRYLVEDHSKAPVKCKIRDNVRELENEHGYSASRVMGWKESQAYYVIVNYKQEKVGSNKFTYDEILKLPECKKLMDDGLKLIPTPRQKKNVSLVFGYQVDYTNDPDRSSLYRNSISDKDPSVFSPFWGIFESGVIRKMPEHASQPQNIGNFGASTLAGWNEGFLTIAKYLEKWKKEMRKEGVEFFDTPELRQRFRGKLSARKFGF